MMARACRAPSSRPWPSVARSSRRIRADAGKPSTNGSTAVSCPPATPRRWPQAMRSFLRRPDLCRPWHAPAGKKSNRRFDVEIVTREMLWMYCWNADMTLATSQSFLAEVNALHCCSINPLASNEFNSSCRCMSPVRAWTRLIGDIARCGFDAGAVARTIRRRT